MSAKSEYLKKYLSKVPTETKKKKKRRKKPDSSVKIIATTTSIVDDDAEDWLQLGGDSEPDRPQIESFFDETEIKNDSTALNNNWKKVQSETSPVRDKKKTQDSIDLSPARRTRHDSPDLSPVRGRTRHDSPDLSPVRGRMRHDSPNLSPVRGRTRHDSPDLSPVRGRTRHDSPDLSPVRRRTRHDSPDLSPVRRRTRHDSPDLSPVRTNTRHDSPDVSPVRRTRRSPDISPVKRRHNDITEKKGQYTELDDLSPPRKSDTGVEVSSKRRRIDATVISAAKPSNVMADGSKAGLVSGKDVTASLLAKRKAADEKFAKMDQGQSSMSSKAVIRDRATGKRIDPKLERLRKREEEAKEVERLEKFKTWGSGVTQQKSREEQMAEDAIEMSKPFARYKDDKDLDKLYRNRSRVDDPMAHLLTKKVESNKPLYKGPPPPTNRYNLWPGYRWDGIDRSNGFEAKFIQAQVSASSRADDAYAWSTEDM